MGSQEQEEHATWKGTTEGGEDQAGLWREGLEAAIRERVREVIEEILHEEVEEALGARRSQHRSLRTTNAIERLQEEFQRRVKTEASLPSEKAALLVCFGLFAGGQVKMPRTEGWSDLAQPAAVAA